MKYSGICKFDFLRFADRFRLRSEVSGWSPGIRYPTTCIYTASLTWEHRFRCFKPLSFREGMTRASSKNHFKGISIPPKIKLFHPSKNQRVKLWQQKIIMISEPRGSLRKGLLLYQEVGATEGFAFGMNLSGQMSWWAGLPPVRKTPNLVVQS